MSSPPRLPESVIQAAIQWSIRLQYNQASPALEADFLRWRQADALHALAWERVTGLAQPFAAVPGPLTQSTLDKAQALRARRRTKRRQVLQALTLGGLVLGSGWLASEQLPWQHLLADASTGLGERRRMTLADGTVLTLNTDSAVSVALSDERVVVLHRGEIAIDTGDDAQAPARRPFWVETPFGRLQALGTKFTVRLQTQGARVAVQEGAVALHPGSGGESHVVHPGQVRLLRLDGSTGADLHGVSADSWADGVIAGENMRLEDLLSELARYRPGVVRCARDVAGLRVSGLFHVQDTDRALRFLEQTQPVRVRYLSRFWVSVEAA